jgi:hypothetical protein
MKRPFITIAIVAASVSAAAAQVNYCTVQQ